MPFEDARQALNHLFYRRADAGLDLTVPVTMVMTMMTTMVVQTALMMILIPGMMTMMLTAHLMKGAP